MFDDILTKNVDLDDYNEMAYCPGCGSCDVQFTDGTFQPGRKFHQTVFCKICGYIWVEVINENMNVEKVLL